MGKTALATELYHQMAEDFPGGRYWLDLRGGEAAGPLRALLALLGVGPQAMPPTLEGLCSAAHALLHGKRALLVLDNAESLAPLEPATVQRLVQQIKLPLPGVTLVTSRVAIDPTGHEFLVDVLDEPDALALLREHLKWSDEQAAREAPDARLLIERLGGLALALDLTARRMAHGGPPPQRCAAALRALDGAAYRVDALHLHPTDPTERTVASAFALSYDPLPARPRAAFHALGLCHPGGASVGALAFLLACSEEEAEAALVTLANRSLAGWVGERTRARLHPLLHDFAAQRADADPAARDALLLRHAHLFGDQIGGAYQRAVNEGLGGAADEALARTDAEADNVRLAQARALADGFPDPHLAVTLTNNLKAYWALRTEPPVSPGSGGPRSLRNDWAAV